MLTKQQRNNHAFAKAQRRFDESVEPDYFEVQEVQECSVCGKFIATDYHVLLGGQVTIICDECYN